MYVKRLGKSLNEFRVERGLSTEQLARIIFIEASEIEALEKGDYIQLGTLTHLKHCLQKYLEFATANPNRIGDVFTYLEAHSFFDDKINPDQRRKTHSQRIIRKLKRWLGMLTLAAVMSVIIVLIFSYLEKNSHYFENITTKAPNETIENTVKNKVLNSRAVDNNNHISSDSRTIEESYEPTPQSISFSVKVASHVTIRDQNGNIIIDEVLLPNEASHFSGYGDLQVVIDTISNE